MHIGAVCASLNILNGMFFGYVLIGIGAAASTIWRCNYGIGEATAQNEWLIGSLFAVINIGGLPYGFVAGTIMNGFGRRKAVMLGGTCSLIGTALSATSTSYFMASVARVITGVGIGAMSSSIPVYVQEMAPEGYVGTFQAIGGPCIPLMIFLGNVAGYAIMGPNRDLPVADFCPLFTAQETASMNLLLMLPGCVIAFCVLVVAFWFMPESKKWKPSSGADWNPDEEEGSRLVPKSPVLKSSSVNTTTASNVELPGGWAGVFKCPRPIITGLLMGVAMQATGINAVMFYAPRFMALGGVSQKMLGSVVIMAWNLFTAILALLLVDRVSRRALLLTGLGLMALSLMLMQPMYAMIATGSLNSVWCFVLLFIFVVGFEFGPGTLFAVIVNEIIPPQVLATASPLVGTTMGCMGILVTFIFPPMEHVLHSSCFFIFGAVAILTWLFFAITLPETRNVQKETITKMMLEGKWLSFGEIVYPQKKQQTNI